MTRRAWGGAPMRLGIRTMQVSVCAGLQKRGLVQYATQGRRKDRPVAGPKTAGRHLLTERGLGAMKVPRHCGGRAQPVSPSQAGHQCTPPGSQIARTGMQVRWTARVELGTHPKRQQFKSAVDAIPSSSSDQAGCCALHRPGHFSAGPDMTRGQNQAARQFPSTAFHIGRTPGNPLAQGLSRRGHRVTKVLQHGPGIEPCGGGEPQGDTKSSMRMVRGCLAGPKKHSTPCQHTKLLKKLALVAESMCPERAGQHGTANWLRLPHPARHDIAECSRHSPDGIVPQQERNCMDLRGQQHKVDEHTSRAAMCIEKPPSNSPHQRGIRQKVAADCGLPAQAPYLRGDATRDAGGINGFGGPH